MKKKSFSDILSDISEAGLARMRRKVPEWADVPGIEYPSRLCTEQCSSSATAASKAALVRRIRPECRLLADLTGGLGVDSYFFSKVSNQVIYNEMDPELAAAVERNFGRLGVTNVSFSSVEVNAETLPGLVADGPDVIYLDPARRSTAGRKVFLLEDCSPDILSLRDGLLAAAPDVLAKLSPMADIAMVCRRLGESVREVHVAGTDGECKELLVWMQRGWNGGCTIEAEGLRFSAQEEGGAAPRLLPGRPAPKGVLFEPAATLLKAGCFNLLCDRLGLFKLGRSTHLYYTEALGEDLRKHGKLFSIKEILPFDGRSVKAVGKALPRCSVTARNLPISSDELSKKMGVTPGGDAHVFAFTADYSGAPSERLMAVTERI
jgi:hypothetical protein